MAISARKRNRINGDKPQSRTNRRQYTKNLHQMPRRSPSALRSAAQREITGHKRTTPAMDATMYKSMRFLTSGVIHQLVLTTLTACGRDTAYASEYYTDKDVTCKNCLRKNA